MVHTVAKFHLLKVFLKCLELLVVAVTIIVGVDILKQVSQREVILAVLIPQNIAARESSLGEIINEKTLAGSEILKSGYLIAEHLDISEAVHNIVEFIVVGVHVHC